MSRINICPACNALKHGVKSRKPFEHIGCEFDRHTYAIEGGSATFVGKPNKEMFDAVNKLTEVALKTLKNRLKNE